MNYLFALAITIIAYYLSLKLKNQIKHPIVNVVVISAVLIFVTLQLVGVEIDSYKESATIITRFLNPLIVLLAVPLYKKRKMLVENLVPILSGIIVSIIIAFASVYVLSLVLGLNQVLIVTLLPKSITTPLAIEASTALEGIPSITVLAVIVTGITGTLIFEVVVKLFGLKTDLAKGIALGAASHAIGTSKALETSKECGASSSLALGLSGIFTVLIVVILTTIF